MRSETSFFNKTLFCKNLSRYWPLWAGYLVLWLLILPLSLAHISLTDNGWSYGYYGLLGMKRQILSMAGDGCAAVAVMAPLTAMAVFSWLYNARSTAFVTALPVSRESLFVSSALSGFAMMSAAHIVTFLVAWLVTAARGTEMLLPLLQWLAVVTLDTLNFYAFAVLCAMLTGTLLVLPVVYGVLQLTVYVVENLVDILLQKIVFGFASGFTVLDFLSPIVQRLRSVHTTPIFESAADGSREVIDYAFVGWGTLAAYAVAGLILTALALALFRRRRMETAGDTVAVAPLKPVFRWCLAVGCALVGSFIVTSILYDNNRVSGTWGVTLTILALLLIWGAVGWFGADMLMYKTFRVFRMHPKGYALFCAILAALTVCVEADVFGYERRIPAEYAAVKLECYGELLSFSGGEARERTEALHESIIRNKAAHESADAFGHVSFLYTDENGDVVLERQYYIANDAPAQTDRSSDLRELERIMNLQESIDQRKALDFAVTRDNIESAGIHDHASAELEPQTKVGEVYIALSEDEAWELYSECILPDIADGTLGRIWLVTDEEYYATVYAATISYEFAMRTEAGTHEYDSFYTTPTIHSVRTNEWLRAHGIELTLEAELPSYESGKMISPSAVYEGTAIG